MIAVRCVALAVLLALTLLEAQASVLRRDLDLLNQRLHGRVVDLTNNHGQDRRLWSSALQQYRDMYVYLPPGFDPERRYPLALFLHGAVQDEQFFLDVVERFDQAMAAGEQKPAILAAPDGSIPGRPAFYPPTSIFVNSRVGRFEDYLMGDVWNYLCTAYPVLPQREAHALIGVSMGGMAAFTHGIQRRDRFKLILGFFPALNMRWVDGQGHYHSKFNPHSWGWRMRFGPNELFGRAKLVAIRFPMLLDPLFGQGAEAIARLSAINPIELLDRCEVKQGDLDMYIAYGGRDEFNIDTQVESFLYRARERGLKVGIDYDPQGRHDVATGLKLLPGAMRWVATHMCR